VVEENRTRMDFKERFEEMIEKYNNYSVNVEIQFEEFLQLEQDLNEERKRSARENMTEEELAMFDIITQRDKIDLTKSERNKIKHGITELIEKLRQEKLVMDWEKQQRRIADVKVTIEKELDDVLPDQYGRKLFTQTCHEVFEHIWQRYCAGYAVTCPEEELSLPPHKLFSSLSFIASSPSFSEYRSIPA